MKKNYSSEFKAKLVLEVLRGERTLREIASENETFKAKQAQKNYENKLMNFKGYRQENADLQR